MDDNLEKKERQINNLINIVENHTRTERHLEQYSEIGNPKNKQNAKEKQQTREKEIKTLKNQILDKNKESTEDQIDNLIDNYQNTQEYIEENYNHLPEEMLNNLNNKQRKRVDQLGNMLK